MDRFYTFCQHSKFAKDNLLIVQHLPATYLREIVSSIDAVASEDRDEMAIPSYLHSNRLIPWLMWRRYRLIAQFSDLSPNQSVLEFGCGIGVFLPTLCASGAKVYAIDLFPHFARKLAADKKLDVTFVHDVGEVPHGSLSVIVAADVLEHIENPTNLLAAFRNKLKPDGRLIVSGPTENLIYKIGRICAGFGDKGDYHVTDIRKLRSVICSAGFTLQRRKGLPFALPPHLFHVLDFRPSRT